MTDYPNVTINDVEYSVYAGTEDADPYLAADVNGDTWADLDATAKAKNLVSSTRLLDRQTWPGPPLDPAQGHAVPFANSDLSPEVQLAKIKEIAIVLANELANGFDASQATTGSNLKMQKAGTVEQEFFYIDPTSATRFPFSVMELLSGLTGGAATGTGFGAGFSSGTCGRSSFDVDYEQDVIP